MDATRREASALRADGWRNAVTETRAQVTSISGQYENPWSSLGLCLCSQTVSEGSVTVLHTHRPQIHCGFSSSGGL